MIYFATGNENKRKEVERILGIEVKGVKLDIDEVQTLDPFECARKKAISAYKIYGSPILVEDTAFFFDAWNGLPGVFIDYFMKTLGNEGLIKLLAGEENRRAKVQTVCAISRDGKTAEIFSGEVTGSISLEPRGGKDFGWSPIFIPDGDSRTFAEMEPEEKDSFSMRRLALEEFRKSL